MPLAARSIARYSAGLFLAGAFVLPAMNASVAMSNAPENTITVECVPQNAKVPAADEICALFVERLAEAYRAYTVLRADEVAQAGLVARLAISHSDPQRIEAALGWVTGEAVVEGPRLGTAVMDATLSHERIVKFLDGLIASTPMP